MNNGQQNRNRAQSEIGELDVQDPLVFQSLQIARLVEQEAINNQFQAQQEKQASTSSDLQQSHYNHQKKVNIVRVKAIECLDQTVLEEDLPYSRKCIHQLENKDQEVIRSMLALPESVVKSAFKSKFLADSFDMCKKCSELYNY